MHHDDAHRGAVLDCGAERTIFEPLRSRRAIAGAGTLKLRSRAVASRFGSFGSAHTPRSGYPPRVGVARDVGHAVGAIREFVP